MKLKRLQFSPLADALRSLTGTRTQPFHFDAKTRYALAKNLLLLSRRAQDANEFRVQAITDLSPTEKTVVPGTPEFQAFADVYGKYIDGVEDIPNLITISFDALNLDGEFKGPDGKPVHPLGNAIPVDVVAALEPLLTGVGDEPAIVKSVMDEDALLEVPAAASPDPIVTG